MHAVMSQPALVVAVALGLGSLLVAVVVSLLEQAAPGFRLPRGVGALRTGTRRARRAELISQAKVELSTLRVWGIFWFASVFTLVATAALTVGTAPAAVLIPGALLYFAGCALLLTQHRLVRRRAMMILRNSQRQEATRAFWLAVRMLGLEHTPTLPVRRAEPAQLAPVPAPGVTVASPEQVPALRPQSGTTGLRGAKDSAARSGRVRGVNAAAAFAAAPAGAESRVA